MYIFSERSPHSPHVLILTSLTQSHSRFFISYELMEITSLSLLYTAASRRSIKCNASNSVLWKQSPSPHGVQSTTPYRSAERNTLSGWSEHWTGIVVCDEQPTKKESPCKTRASVDRSVLGQDAASVPFSYF